MRKQGPVKGFKVKDVGKYRAGLAARRIQAGVAGGG